MVAAGRGVLLAPEIVLYHRSAGVSLHVLDGLKEELEIVLLRRESPGPAPTVDNFVKILAESVLSLKKLISTNRGQWTERRAGGQTRKGS
jgi:DNA-binding transcriptional LysR family regulator